MIDTLAGFIELVAPYMFLMGMISCLIALAVIPIVLIVAVVLHLIDIFRR